MKQMDQHNIFVLCIYWVRSAQRMLTMMFNGGLCNYIYEPLGSNEQGISSLFE